MKVISLNIWMGREFDTLIEYITKQAKDTDVFCFQEVFHTTSTHKIVNGDNRANTFYELQQALPEFNGEFSQALEEEGIQNKEKVPLKFGIALFVKKSIQINKINDFYIYKNSESKNPPRTLQYIELNKNNTIYTIAHFHGIWTGQGKQDTPERIKQSELAVKFLEKAKGKKILCGDFNLTPNTESIAIIEKKYNNLIKKYNIQTTRSKLYTKPEKFADYTFVSSDVQVESFEVPYSEASDHLPMILKFS